MISNVNNLIAAAAAGAKKSNGTSGSNISSGSFEALLSILMNQGMNFPGNDLMGLDEESGQDSALGFSNLNLLSILGKGNLSGNSGTASLDETLIKLLESRENNSADMQSILSNLMPQVLGSILNTGSSGQGVSGNTGETGLPSVLSSILPLLEMKNAAAGSNADAKTVPGSSASAGNSNTAPTGQAITSEIQVNQPEVQTIGNVITQAGMDLKQTGIDDTKVSQGKAETGNGVVQQNTQVSDESALKQVKVQAPAADSYKPVQSSNSLQGYQQSAGTSDSQTNPAAGSESPKAGLPNEEGRTRTVQKDNVDRDYVVQRSDLLKIMRNNSSSKSETGFDGNSPKKEDREKAGSTGELKEAVKTEALKLQDNMKPADKPMDTFQTIPQQKSIQGNGVHQTHTNPGQMAEVNKDDVLNQLYDKIKVINNNGTSELHVNLKPEELGEVTIKLVMDKGVMTGRILVENSHVKSIIESSMSQLKDSIKLQTPNVSDFSVSVGLRQDNQQYNQNYSQNRWTMQRNAFSGGEEEERTDIIRPAAVNTGRVNLLA